MKIKLILLFIILLHIGFFLFSVNQMYYGDEIVFITAARDISKGNITGHFGFEKGEIDKTLSKMVIHPPLYIYLLSLSIFLFRESPYSIRSISLIFSIGSIILVFLITRHILKKRKFNKADEFALFASFLYSIIPLAIQNLILVDIDGGLLNFSVLLFVYFYISEKSYKFLIPSLFLIFLSKLTALSVLFGSLVLVAIITFNFKEILRIFLIFLTTGIIFTLLFFTYCHIFGLDYLNLFKYNSALPVILLLFKTPLPILLRSFWAFKLFFYFSTPFLILLFIFISFNLVKSLKKSNITENKDLLFLLIYPVLTICLYLITGLSGWNFPKYHISTIPYIVIMISFFSANIQFKTLIKNNFKTLIITLFIILLYFIFILKDPLIPELNSRVSNSDIILALKLVFLNSLKYALIPLILSLALFKNFSKQRIIFTLLFLTILTCFYINIIQANADYSTHNIYGDRGLKETLEYIKDIPANKIIAYPHIVFYKDYLNTFELTSAFNDPTLLKDLIENKKIEYIICYEKDLEKINFLNFKLDKKIGDYFILKK